LIPNIDVFPKNICSTIIAINIEIKIKITPNIILTQKLMFFILYLNFSFSSVF